jgi:hypothetical protein
VEQIRDSRRLMHPYRLTDGTTARLSTFDVLAALRDGLARDYAERHDEPADDQPPNDVVRTLARLDTDHDTSMFGRLTQQLSAAWCDTHDNPEDTDA